jgi:hypothetical protein
MSALSTDPSPVLPLEPGRPPVPGGQWSRDSELPQTRPSSLRQDDRSSWSSTESPSRNNLTHELLRVASRVRRRRTPLPESSPRRGPSGFLNALHQVESGLLHINRELSALADEDGESMRRFSLPTEPVAPQVTRPTAHDHSHEDAPPSSRMDWTFDRNLDHVERNSSPPTLPPFEFSQLQRNSDWPSSRRNYLDRRYEEEEDLLRDSHSGSSTRPAPARSLANYLEQRQPPRDALPRAVRPSYAYDNSWRADSLGAEPWSNDATSSSGSGATSMPMRDRLLFRASAPSREPPDSTSRGRILRHPDLPAVRDNAGGAPAPPSQPSASFARLHRRRPSPPTTHGHQPASSSNLPRPFPQQPASPSPPRSHTSRFSHLLPRRVSGRGAAQSGANIDDNEEWNHPGSSGRMFFLRPRGRVRTTSGGDFLRDDEFDDSYEGLLRLAARIGDAKPRGTPSEVIQAMPSGSYASCPGAKAESRCPICLDDYAQEDIVALIKHCSHWFHKECIQVSGRTFVK